MLAIKINWCEQAVNRVPAYSVVINLKKLKDLSTHFIASRDGLTALDLFLKVAKKLLSSSWKHRATSAADGIPAVAQDE